MGAIEEHLPGARAFLAQDQRDAAQRGEGDARLARKRMLGRKRDHELVEVVAPHREAAIVHRAFHETEIDLVLDDHLHDAVGVGHQQADVHLREPLLEAHEQPRQVVLGDGHARPEHQGAGHVVGQLPERALHLGVQGEDAGRVLLHPTSPPRSARCGCARGRRAGC